MKSESHILIKENALQTSTLKQQCKCVIVGGYYLTSEHKVSAKCRLKHNIGSIFLHVQNFSTLQFTPTRCHFFLKLTCQENDMAKYIESVSHWFSIRESVRKRKQISTANNQKFVLAWHLSLNIQLYYWQISIHYICFRRVCVLYQ